MTDRTLTDIAADAITAELFGLTTPSHSAQLARAVLEAVGVDPSCPESLWQWHQADVARSCPVCPYTGKTP